MKVALYGRTPKQDDIKYVQNLISEIESTNPYVFIYSTFYEKIKDKIGFSKPHKTFSNKKELEEKYQVKYVELFYLIYGKTV